MIDNLFFSFLLLVFTHIYDNKIIEIQYFWTSSNVLVTLWLTENLEVVFWFFLHNKPKTNMFYKYIKIY